MDWAKSSGNSEEEDLDEESRPKPKYIQGALLVIDNKSGGIRALVGGRDYAHSAYDRAMLSRRKPGTAFVPFVYAAGFAQGQFPGSKVDDSPIDNKHTQIGGEGGILGEWGVETIELNYEGWIPARSALMKGKNAAVVRFGIDLGVDSVVGFAQEAGITFEGEIQKYNSTFLGNSEASMKEMALAYTIFPNKGQRANDVFIIDSIRDREGNVIFAQENQEPTVDVLDPYSAFQVHNSLKAALDEGTGQLARLEYGLGDFPAAGKTGTAYGFKDDWFIGYTDQVTCAVWAGFDRAKPIYQGAFSNRTVLPIWTEVMNEAAEIFPPSEVTPPEAAKEVHLCKISGDKATEYCYHQKQVDGQPQIIKDTYKEYINPKYELTRLCAVHGPGGRINRQMLQPIQPMIIADGSSGVRRLSGYGLSVQPVFLQQPTVLGVDPYSSVVPKMRPRIISPTPGPLTPTADPAPRRQDVLPSILDEKPLEAITAPTAETIEFD